MKIIYDKESDITRIEISGDEAIITADFAVERIDPVVILPPLLREKINLATRLSNLANHNWQTAFFAALCKYMVLSETLQSDLIKLIQKKG